MVLHKKLKAESALSELKTILGWDWDSRRLIISLPANKYTAWSKIISDTISSGHVAAKEFESTIRRLIYLALVVPFVNHFLSRLRELLRKAKVSPVGRQRSPPMHQQSPAHDIFIKKAHEGVSMNQIAYPKPTHVYWSDSCPAGIGGYSHEGFA